MGPEVNWRPHVLVSDLHAAHAAACQRTFADPSLATAIEQPAIQLAAEIRAAQLPSERFWGHLIPLAANIAGWRQLVETAVTKTVGRGPRFEAAVANLAACVAGVDNAAREALPDLDDELSLRERPLREQWEARGPGMLSQIGRLTEESLIVPQCDVLLVHPALGGGGEAHLAYNSVRIEAVLANPVADLPEVVRLAWLVAQLQLDVPIQSESIHAERLPHVAQYAMLLPALLAAESVELVRSGLDQLPHAIASWGLTAPEGVDAAALVSQWWQTYQETRPPWRVALAALDQLFG